MKVTLSQAIRLRNTLEKTSIPQESMVIPVRSDTGVDNKEVEKASELFSKSLTNGIQAIAVLFKLRELIDEMNHKSGVNKIIAQIACTDRIVKCLSDQLMSIQSGARYGIDAESLKAKIEFKNKMEEHGPEYMRGPEAFNLLVINPEELIKNLKEKVAGAKLVSAELQEQRNGINAVNRIELPDDVVEFLREYSLLPKA